MMAQIGAEMLGVPLENVTVMPGTGRKGDPLSIITTS
jgi:hypothetical protein